MGLNELGISYLGLSGFARNIISASHHFWGVWLNFIQALYILLILVSMLYGKFWNTIDFKPSGPPELWALISLKASFTLFGSRKLKLFSSLSLTILSWGSEPAFSYSEQSNLELRLLAVLPGKYESIRVFVGLPTFIAILHHWDWILLLLVNNFV